MNNDVDAKKIREYYMHLIPALKKWLADEDLIDFFKEAKRRGGCVNTIWIAESGMPYIVHFREGMEVRNKLRDLTDNSWSAYEYDNTWAEIIEECIC